MIALVGSYLRKWTFFWEKLKQLEDAIGDEGAFYRQLRRETTGGLVLIFLVTGRCFSIVKFDLMPKETVKLKKKNEIQELMLNKTM